VATLCRLQNGRNFIDIICVVTSFDPLHSPDSFLIKADSAHSMAISTELAINTAYSTHGGGQKSWLRFNLWEPYGSAIKCLGGMDNARWI